MSMIVWPSYMTIAWPSHEAYTAGAPAGCLSVEVRTTCPEFRKALEDRGWKRIVIKKEGDKLIAEAKQ